MWMVIIAFGLAAGSVPPDSIAAEIGVERSDTGVTLTARYHGTADDELEYRLVVRKSGPAGTSDSSQSGRFVPSGEGGHTLSTSRVNLSDGDHLAATLVLTRRGDVVARDEYRYPEP